MGLKKPNHNFSYHTVRAKVKVTKNLIDKINKIKIFKQMNKQSRDKKEKDHLMQKRTPWLDLFREN